LLYGLSRSGIFFAGSLWSIGHPFFYVWTVYFCFLWVRQNDSGYLAAALVTWSVGMYVDMVLAPAVFILPVLWLIYRPKVRIAPLALAVAVIAAVWYPYLRLEKNRDFTDLKTLVLRQRIHPSDYKGSWCMPTLALKKVNGTGDSSGAEPDPPYSQIPDASAQPAKVHTGFGDLTEKIRLRYTTLGDGLVFNFDQMAWTPLAYLPLQLLGMTTLAFIALQASARSRAFANSGNWLVWIPRFAWLLVFLALVVNEVFVARFLSANGSLNRVTILNIRMLQAILLLTGLGLLVWKKSLTDLLRGLIVQLKAESDSSQTQVNCTLFGLCLLVPWATLIMVVEAGNQVRYWWLWPLQIVPIVAAVTYIPERLKWPRAAGLIGQIGLVLMLLSHPWLSSPVKAWAGSGWSGQRADEIQAMDYIASEIRSQGRDSAAIGYNTFIYEFMPAFNIVDPTYKAGAELDLYLKDRHRVSNSNQCAEGVSPEDEYRLVQTSPRPLEEPQFGPAQESQEYFDAPLDSSYRMLREFGRYRVFGRTGSSGQ